MDFDFMLLLDISAVIAAAISGSLLGAKKKMDYFGICILGIVASVGGGVTRDLIIGRTPPVMFSDPTFVTVAFIVSNIVFFTLFLHINIRSRKNLVNQVFEKVLFWFDAIGLAAFTADGVLIGKTLMPEYGLFLCVFLGVITGVGGGVLRDLLAGEVPAIFVRHIYAMASIVGAIAEYMIWNYVPDYVAVGVCFALVITIRFFAKKYRWNLPHIK